MERNCVDTHASGPILQQNSIWPGVCAVYSEAYASGAILKIDSTVSLLTEDSSGVVVPWVLRLAEILKKKPAASSEPAPGPASPAKPFNPFDPPEKALTVGHLSDTHTLVLNKFNVVEHHTIVITREFQPQTDPLNACDLDATFKVLRSMPQGGLGFFNCGEHSGRSQPHKHVQIVPLPFVQGQPAAPTTAAAILSNVATNRAFEVAETRSLPFRGFCCKLASGASADQLASAFASLLDAASTSASADEPLSYNWLGCEDFMAIFPRSREKADLLAVNALGFAGTFLCRSEQEVDFVKARGGMSMLEEVGQPW